MEITVVVVVVEVEMVVETKLTKKLAVAASPLEHGPAPAHPVTLTVT